MRHGDEHKGPGTRAQLWGKSPLWWNISPADSKCKDCEAHGSVLENQGERKQVR